MDNRFMPLVVAAVMFALGLTLTVADFRRAATVRRPLLVALICQSVALPAVCLMTAEALHLSPNLAVGLMLLAATPGGMLANLVSHLAGGDLALNLTLSAINAVLSIVTTPAVLAFSLTWFFGEGRFIPLQFDKFVAVFAVVLIPVAIGVAIRRHFPNFAQRLHDVVRVAAAALLGLAVAEGIVHSQATLWNNFGVLSTAVVSLCAASLTLGYVVSRRMRLGPPQALAISLEIGLHNAVVAVGIALSPQLLNNAEMALPATVYAIIGPLIALGFVYIVRRIDPAHRQRAVDARARWSRKPCESA
jgi:bile acid:Na+ symporter, BASS family